MKTPRLDALAAGGIRMDRAYCSNPVCTPSRVSILTGRQVSRHGAWNVGVQTPPSTQMLGHWLADAGYRTHAIGKLHLSPYGDPDSFEFRHRGEAADLVPNEGPYFGFESLELSCGHGNWGMNGHYGKWLQERMNVETLNKLREPSPRGSVSFGANAGDWDLPVSLHSSVWAADRACAFLNEHRDRPFFLSVGFQDPHHPHLLCRDFDDRVGATDVPMPDFREGELLDKPPHFQAARTGRLEPWKGVYDVAGQSMKSSEEVTPADAREARAYYYSMVQLLDCELGRILDKLDEMGLAKDTIVIFTTDHGELLGDHGLWLKGPFHYEELVRVPCIIRWPSRMAGGRTSDELFSLVDLAPTLLAAAEVDMPEGFFDGHNALPSLTGDRSRHREDVLIECVDDPKGLRLKTLVTKDRKLTWYHGHDFGEFYDLSVDPSEKQNLWNDPARNEEKSRLLARILELAEAPEKALRGRRTCYA